MFDVDQRGESRLGTVIPLAGRGFTAGVLGSRDDFKIPVVTRVVEFFVDFLPAWQIEPAPSPTRPGDHQDFLTSEIAQVDDSAATVGHGEIGRGPRIVKCASQYWNFAEAMDTAVLIGHRDLADFAREPAQIEILIFHQSLGERDAQIFAAGAFGFNFEIVDLRKIGLENPEIARIGHGFVERYCASPVEHDGGRLRRGRSHGSGGSRQNE
jgi:hypothetical protein